MNKQQINQARQAVGENPKTISIVDRIGIDNINETKTEIIERFNIDENTILKTRRLAVI